MLQRAAAAQRVMRARRLHAVRRGFGDPNNIAAQHAVNIAAELGFDQIAGQRAIDKDALALRGTDTFAFGI